MLFESGDLSTSWNPGNSAMQKLDHDFDGKLKGFERTFAAGRLQDFARNVTGNPPQKPDIFDGYATSHRKGGVLMMIAAMALTSFIAFCAVILSRG